MDSVAKIGILHSLAAAIGAPEQALRLLISILLGINENDKFLIYILILMEIIIMHFDV